MSPAQQAAAADGAPHRSRPARWTGRHVGWRPPPSATTVKPLVLGPALIPEVVDAAQAEKETELAILSATVHGNGPNGLAVVLAALGALGRLDHEHFAVYFPVIYDALREPVRSALEALVMERQIEGKVTFPPFVQKVFDQGKLEGKLEGVRGVLVRFLERARIPLTDEDRTRIQACTDAATLDRWIENVLGAKTAADVFS